ncbi:MAG: hypothetical protein EA370_10825 [Wenzhouxiangella sp.]|nr:MAG: hypothetical protein EA370_10825 [Wenzhouxiangella sp.]
MGQVNDVEHIEDLEVAPVSGRDSLDTRTVIIGGEQSIKNALDWYPDQSKAGFQHLIKQVIDGR